MTANPGVRAMGGEAAIKPPERQAPLMSNETSAELKGLLFGPELKRLDGLEKEVFRPRDSAAEIGAALADAIQVANREPAKLITALQDPYLEVTAVAARRETERLADALAPVIGPSIRKSISEALKVFLESIETVATHNFSAKGLAWRWEAMRSGVAFRSIVLKHTLRYSVEQVYLIQKPSGLLVANIHQTYIDPQLVDQDSVAGMMMALQSFVKDAAFASESKDLETIQLGDRMVWVVHGGWALLACVIQGVPPMELRAEIKTTLDEIHGRYQHELRAFSGDGGSLDAVKPLLEPLLQQEKASEGSVKRRRLSPIKLLGYASLVLLLLWVGWSILQAREMVKLRDAALTTPGLFVGDIERRGRQYVVRALADPLAFKPADLAKRADLAPQRLTLQLTPFVSLEPSLLQQRASTALQPPASVVLEVTGQTLLARGIAEKAWLDRATLIARALPFFVGIDFSGVIASELQQVNKLRQEIDRSRVYFDSQAEFAANAAATLAGLALSIKSLQDLSPALDLRHRVVLIGHSDGVGSAQLNAALREKRAQAVMTRLRELGVDASILEIHPASEQATAFDPSSRAVEVRVESLPVHGAATPANKS